MKYALIIGNTSYTDSKLRQLKTPEADSLELAKILESNDVGGFDLVKLVVNKNVNDVRIEISSFFNNKKPDDLLLLYFSGHGVLDDRGRLFLALIDTQIELLTATGIPSSFISEEMDRCRSKRQVLILDCCNSGAFKYGRKGTQKPVTESTFKGNGYGHVVLTATDSTQYAFEGDRIISQSDLSLFTHFLVNGLKTGEADLNNDGIISLDELYEYTFEKTVSATPDQSPQKFTYSQKGYLIIAKNFQYELRKRELAEQIAREKAEKEATEKAGLEAKEIARQKANKEKLERETAEKAARDKAEKEAVEKARLEAEEQVMQKANKEKVERKAAEKVARERIEKKTAKNAELEAEKAFREKVEKARMEADKRASKKNVVEKPERESVKDVTREKAKKVYGQKSTSGVKAGNFVFGAMGVFGVAAICVTGALMGFSLLRSLGTVSTEPTQMLFSSPTSSLTPMLMTDPTFALPATLNSTLVVTQTPRPTTTLTIATLQTSEPTATKTVRPTATRTPEPTATKTVRPTATRTPEPTVTRTARPTVTRTPRVTKISPFINYSGKPGQVPARITFHAENSYLIYEDGTRKDCFLAKCTYKWVFPDDVVIDFSSSVGSQVFTFTRSGEFKVLLKVCWQSVCSVDYYYKIKIN